MGQIEHRGGIAPYPRFENTLGTFVKVCFAYACLETTSCWRARICPKAHLSIVGTHTAPRQALNGVRAWFLSPKVAARARLTQAAAAIPDLF